MFLPLCINLSLNQRKGTNSHPVSCSKKFRPPTAAYISHHTAHILFGWRRTRASSQTSFYTEHFWNSHSRRKRNHYFLPIKSTFVHSSISAVGCLLLLMILEQILFAAPLRGNKVLHVCTWFWGGKRAADSHRHNVLVQMVLQVS